MKKRIEQAEREHPALSKRPDPELEATDEDQMPDIEVLGDEIVDTDAELAKIVMQFTVEGGTLQALDGAINFAIDEMDLSEAYIDPLARQLHAAGANHHYTLANLRDRIKGDLRATYGATQPDVSSVPVMSETEAETGSADLRAVPDLMAHGIDVVHRLGVVGEITTIKAVILASVSRLFAKPSNLLLLGEPGTGKSTTIEAALQLLPPDALKFVNNMSPRALAYSDFDFRHSVFFLAEGTPLAGPDDDPAKSMLRTMISEGRVVYETVQPDAEGALRTMTMEREGPISFITCHVSPLQESQIASRLIEIPTDQSADQTDAVLTALAHSAAGGAVDTPTAELEQWRALHVWLSYQPTRVLVPYAPTIVQLFGQRSNRSPRDMNQILALIKASAFLHSGTRDVDEDGQVTAILDDYGHAYDALAVGIDSAADTKPHGNVDTLLEYLRTELTDPPRKSGLPKRENLKVADPIIGKVLHTSVRELAEALGMARSTCHRAVKSACNAGYLENQTARHNSRMQLEILHLPNQSTTSTMPAPNRLAAVLAGAPDPATAPGLTPVETERGTGDGG